MYMYTAKAWIPTLFALALLLVIATPFLFLSVPTADRAVQSVEYNLAVQSPSGSSGGFIIPASCPSYAHSPGECDPPPPAPPSFSASGGSAGGSGSGSGTSINEGGSATLTWACADSSSSSGVNFSTGGAVSGSAVVTPADTTEYTVICSNGGQASVTVTVLHPTLSITATPSLLRVGETSQISWSATAVNSCSISEDNPDFADSWSGTSGTQTTSALTGQPTYTLL